MKTKDIYVHNIDEYSKKGINIPVLGEIWAVEESKRGMRALPLRLANEKLVVFRGTRSECEEYVRG